MQSKPVWEIRSRDILILIAAGLIVAFLYWMYNDLGKVVTWAFVFFVFGICITIAIATISGIGFRLAQRSDNLEITMGGVHKAQLELMAAQQRAQVDQLRAYAQIVPPQSAPMPSLPWATNNDATDAEPSFEAEDVWVGGGNAARH